MFVHVVKSKIHRVKVTGEDCGASEVGLIREGDDPEIIGTILARDVDRFKAGHEIEKQDLSTLRDKKVVTRSLVTCQQGEGVCQKCSGRRENNEFPPLGSHIGLTSSKAHCSHLTTNCQIVHHFISFIMSFSSNPKEHSKSSFPFYHFTPTTF